MAIARLLGGVLAVLTAMRMPWTAGLGGDFEKLLR